jgi:hypothetical protein
MISRATAAIILAVMFSAATTVATQNRSTPLTGTWSFTVTSGDTTGTPTVSFTQRDETLTGHYSSTVFGEAEPKGAVTGAAVKFTVFATYQGERQDLVFSGEYDGSRTIKGSYSNNFGSGSFTALRK